eukprot:CAMPEP_0175945656 /NCGR_PEP_ID=MMETSP0108-20121206/26837_1 /TAXON_ID=195067 ORGANISM="Goniomonas pacifica, Strain CCMP1869" /NCGR_SAMPLE_ID=MMETSP0108 /ASSEMBLY_ACC=CAM_ASM_000204 /LENGTH=112 /DNA_ID=CAMNT_0017270971 /DNA_START=483 /DNA_END=818 /DNA_ORIENTATION=+
MTGRPASSSGTHSKRDMNAEEVDVPSCLASASVCLDVLKPKPLSPRVTPHMNNTLSSRAPVSAASEDETIESSNDAALIKFSAVARATVRFMIGRPFIKVETSWLARARTST